MIHIMATTMLRIGHSDYIDGEDVAEGLANHMMNDSAYELFTSGDVLKVLDEMIEKYS